MAAPGSLLCNRGIARFKNEFLYSSIFEFLAILTNSIDCKAAMEDVVVARAGIILPAFKAATLDFNSIQRVKRIEEERKADKIISKKEKTNFIIDSNINLKDILIKNSTSRKKVIE